MKKRPQWIKKADTYRKITVETSFAWLKKLGSQVNKKAGEVKERHNVSERTSILMRSAKKTLRDIDSRHAISEKVKVGKDALVKKFGDINEYTKERRLKEKAKRVGQVLDVGVIKPVVRIADDSGATKKFGRVFRAVVDRYGETRAWMKPYYAPETPDELLHNTKRELIYINACILQISRDEAEQLANKLGAAIVSKIAGFTSVAALLGIVSTFGTASTGTAIATLHGAAATNATLYWVGNLLGGGMATGVVLTGGVALIVAISVYKLIGSDARRFEDLSEHELEIVGATGFLIAAINDVLEDPKKSLNANEAGLLLQNTLIPLHQSLLDHGDDICENLDNKHKILFRKHAIVDFEKSVLDGFEFFIQEENESRRRYPEFVIAGVLYALLTQSVVDDSRESQLALTAIRRMKTEWNDASESQLSNDLSQYEPEQLKGIANNAKGIYHEILFVDDYNSSHNETYAELFGDTNHAGADVQIKLTETDEVQKEFQLKATSNQHLVTEHYEKYPNIDVLATEEFARESSLAESSGISNLEITEQMDRTLADIADNTVSDRVEESAALAGLIVAGSEAIQVLRGNRSIREAGINTVKSATVVATSTALVAYLFN